MAKRIVSLALVVVLIGMYIATMICAILSTPETKGMFYGSLIMTMVVPIVLWFFLGMYKRVHKDDDKNISLSEMRKYKKRIKQGESPEDIAKEIEEKYNIKEN